MSFLPRSTRHAQAFAALFLLLGLGLSTSALAQGPPLLRETFSREISVFVGTELIPPGAKEIVSREASLFVGTEPEGAYHEIFFAGAQSPRHHASRSGQNHRLAHHEQPDG